MLVGWLRGQCQLRGRWGIGPLYGEISKLPIQPEKGGEGIPKSIAHIPVPVAMSRTF